MEIITSIISGGLGAAIISFLMKSWISERLKNAIKNEYDLKLEEFKIKLELDFKNEMRRRELYDDFSSFIENTFSSGPMQANENLSLSLNKFFGKLALVAPDDVYTNLKNALIDKGIQYGKDVKPTIYCTLRKSIFGQDTKFESKDFVSHIKAEHSPELPQGTSPNQSLKPTPPRTGGAA